MSSGTGKRRPERVPMVSHPASSPVSRSLADVRGQIFYERPGNRPDVVRLHPSDGTTETVLPNVPSRVGISPDGSRIAYVQDGKLLVARTGAGAATQMASGVAAAAQPPAWSPDGSQLLVGAGTPAILQVGSGTLTPLPRAVQAGRHVRWSGDGRKLVYATSRCGLQVAGSSGVTDTAVPVVGSQGTNVNPDGIAACKPTSVDITGERVTVPLRSTGEPSTDGPDTADTVVDTVTGAIVPLPVEGVVIGTVFGPDGHLLVRWVRSGTTNLSLFAPDGGLLVQAAEPPVLSDLDLLAYTR
jgi:TolB protein